MTEPIRIAATPYEPPRVERVLSEADLIHEVLYAGAASQDGSTG